MTDKETTALDADVANVRALVKSAAAADNSTSALAYAQAAAQAGQAIALVAPIARWGMGGLGGQVLNPVPSQAEVVPLKSVAPEDDGQGGGSSA